jgi:hypothetical protein
MNRELVCVKVDREERPDVDRVHMTALQALTGQGGWPLNMFLTPEGKPFLGGTYFPPADRGGRPGWATLVQRVGAAWRTPEHRAQMLERGERLHDAVAELLTAAPTPAEGDARAVVDAVWTALRAAHDDPRGGFSPAPKFPMPVYPHFLLRCLAADPVGRPPRRHPPKCSPRRCAPWPEAASSTRWAAVSTAIPPTANGTCPISKKCFTTTPSSPSISLKPTGPRGTPFTNPSRAAPSITRGDALGLPGGGFASGEDADSLVPGGAEKKEGAFYLWTEAEINARLGDRAAAFSAAFGVLPRRERPLRPFRGVRRPQHFVPRPRRGFYVRVKQVVHRPRPSPPPFF